MRRDGAPHPAKLRAQNCVLFRHHTVRTHSLKIAPPPQPILFVDAIRGDPIERRRATL